MLSDLTSWTERRRRALIGVVLAVCSAMIIATALAPKAKAGTSWTGCGAGVHGGLVEGAVATSPGSFGFTGQAAGVNVFCDYQMQALVAGAFVEYDLVWGDLKTFGVKDFYTVGGRVGALPSQNALIYTGLQWTRVEASGGDHADAWGILGGIDVKIPKTPVSFDLRYTHLFVDNKDIAPGMDVRGDSIRFGLNFKFGPNLQPVVFDDSLDVAPPAPCDPKLANCKKVKP